jgi:SsrA-binding protein
MEKTKFKNLATNRKAKFDYEIIQTYEAGIELTGYEVKLVRAGKISLQEAFISVKNEAFLKQAHISVEEGNQSSNFFIKSSPDGDRDKKLLLHKKEIRQLKEEVEKNNGYTVIPLSIFSNEKGLIKVSIALARGKKNYDKRQSLKEKDIQMDMKRALKGE